MEETMNKYYFGIYQFYALKDHGTFKPFRKFVQIRSMHMLLYRMRQSGKSNYKHYLWISFVDVGRAEFSSPNINQNILSNKLLACWKKPTVNDSNILQSYLAPYPIKQAKWWVLKHWAVSATIEADILRPFWIKCWWMAPTARSIGMAGRVGSYIRQDI